MKNCPVCKLGRIAIIQKTLYDLNSLGQVSKKGVPLITTNFDPTSRDNDPANLTAQCLSCKRNFPMEKTPYTGTIRIKKPKVFIAQVVWYAANPATETQILESVMHEGIRTCECCGDASGFIIGRGRSQSSLLPVARTTAAKMALKTDAEFVLFIDQDTVEFDAAAIYRMAALNLPIVSAYVCRRSPPYDPVHRYLSEEGHPQTPCITEDELSKLETGKIQECWGVGMAFTMVRRDVLEAIGEPYFRFLPANYSDNDKTSGWFHGEDHSFCLLAKEKGFSNYVDCGIHLGHMHEKALGVDDWIEFSSQADAAQKEKDAKVLGEQEETVTCQTIPESTHSNGEHTSTMVPSSINSMMTQSILNTSSTNWKQELPTSTSLR